MVFLSKTVKEDWSRVTIKSIRRQFESRIGDENRILVLHEHLVILTFFVSIVNRGGKVNSLFDLFDELQCVI